jgi:D-tyrosyl-tRNA(Tyr) deacylase
VKCVLQRVSRAEVWVKGERIASIGRGLVALVAVEREDTEEAVRWMARKIAHLRVFDDEEGKLNRSVLETGGDVLLVSNFTISGNCERGRRPSFDKAAPFAEGERLYGILIEALRGEGVAVETGVYGEQMRVVIENEGPVTLFLSR